MRVLLIIVPTYRLLIWYHVILTFTRTHFSRYYFYDRLPSAGLPRGLIITESRKPVLILFSLLLWIFHIAAFVNRPRMAPPVWTVFTHSFRLIYTRYCGRSSFDSSRIIDSFTYWTQYSPESHGKKTLFASQFCIDRLMGPIWQLNIR